MSQDEQKYAFFAKKGSPFHQILESLKASSGQSFRGEIEDALLLFRYPYLLQEQGASTEQVIRQAEESIRRLNLKITALTSLITSMPRESQSHLSPSSTVSESLPQKQSKAQTEEFEEEQGQSFYVSEHF